MKQFVFTCELHKEYQKEGYTHWNTQIVIVAESTEKALEKLSQPKYSKIHYYSSDFKVYDLLTVDDLQKALKLENESLKNLNQKESKALAWIIALAGAEMGSLQVNTNGGRTRKHTNCIFTDETVIRFI